MSNQENIISAQIDGGLHENQALLDDFAKAAMQEQIGSDGYSQDPKFIVKHAYDIAEAMMHERERRMKG